MSTPPSSPPRDAIIPRPIEDEVKQSYLRYSMSVIFAVRFPMRAMDSSPLNAGFFTRCAS